MGSFYRPLDETTFESLPSTAGPWSPHAQHAGPPAALLARAMVRHDPDPATRLADVRLDILGPIPVAPVTVDVEVLRGGRSMQLLQATASVDGRPAAVARGWRVRRAPEDFPRLAGWRGDAPNPVPEPDGQGRLDLPGMHADGYISDIEWRFVEGGWAPVAPPWRGDASSSRCCPTRSRRRGSAPSSSPTPAVASP